jgi:hypothetical protein
MCEFSEKETCTGILAADFTGYGLPLFGIASFLFVVLKCRK